MLTYYNKNGRPIIRSCSNCVNFKPLATDQKMGYCLVSKMLFAYTMEDSIYFMTKSFGLCYKHEFANEELLKTTAKTVDQKEVLKRKDEVDK